MRCNCIKCHYNDDYYCCQPDYVSIDQYGECEQLFLKPEESVNIEDSDEDCAYGREENNLPKAL